MDKKNNKRIIFIPGWLDQGGNFPQFENVLEIWKENIKPEIKIEADIIIAHSLGCHFALFNWENIKSKKIIFVNPLAANRNVFVWLWRWIRSHFQEKENKKLRIINPLKILRAFFYSLKFLVSDAFQKIEIKDTDLLVIRGKNDLFFCDESSVEFLRGIEVELKEIDNVGHFWNEKIDEEIKRIINN